MIYEGVTSFTHRGSRLGSTITYVALFRRHHFIGLVIRFMCQSSIIYAGIALLHHRYPVSLKAIYNSGLLNTSTNVLTIGITVWKLLLFDRSNFVSPLHIIIFNITSLSWYLSKPAYLQLKAKMRGYDDSCGEHNGQNYLKSIFILMSLLYMDLK